jgi:hypothetical protein
MDPMYSINKEMLLIVINNNIKNLFNTMLLINITFDLCFFFYLINIPYIFLYKNILIFLFNHSIVYKIIFIMIILNFITKIYYDKFLNKLKILNK